MDPSTVLLARPHPTIVEGMSTFLSDAGYQPTPIVSLADIRNWPSADLAAIVISTSIASAVQGTFEEVVRAAVRAHPAAPLIFATVVDAGHARSLLSETLAAYGLHIHICTVDDIQASGIRRDQRKPALLLNRADLQGDKARQRAAIALNVLLPGAH